MTAGIGLETGDSGDPASLILASLILASLTSTIAALSYSSDVITRLLSTDATECWDRTTSFYGVFVALIVAYPVHTLHV
jgi:hypothetical protein